MQDEKAFQVFGQPVLSDHAEGGKVHGTFAIVGDALGNVEHIFVIDRNGPRKDLTGTVVPGQGHGAVDAQRLTFAQGPERIDAGHGIGCQARACGPAVQRVVGVARPFGGVQRDNFGILIKRGLIVIQFQIVDPTTHERDGAADLVRCDGHARCVCQSRAAAFGGGSFAFVGAGRRSGISRGGRDGSAVCGLAHFDVGL